MTPTEAERLATLEQRATQHDIEIRDLKESVDRLLDALRSYWPKSAALVIGGSSAVIGFLIALLAVAAKG